MKTKTKKLGTVNYAAENIVSLVFPLLCQHLTDQLSYTKSR